MFSRFKNQSRTHSNEQPAIFHLVQEKGLIFNDELRFLSSAQPPVKLSLRLMFLPTKDGKQGSTVRDESKYFDKILDMKNKDDIVYNILICWTLLIIGFVYLVKVGRMRRRNTLFRL